METSVHALLAALLPDWQDAQLTSCSVEAQTIILCFAIPTATARCPRCGAASAKVRDRYRRTAADLSWAGARIRLHVLVRKFSCLEPECSQRIFTERLPHLPPYARCTPRLRERQLRLALALGGEAAARLSQTLHHPASATTLLRRIRQMPEPEKEHPFALGVDDWAMRKGHRYGTILVDLEARRPIDLLPDRTSDTLIAWLKEQPQIGVLSRDRSTEYARAATQGAPQALQVADRFHLLANLRESLERLVARHRSDLSGIVIPSVLSRGSDTPAPMVHRPARRSPEEEALRRQNGQARRARFDAIHALKADGVNICEISRRLHLSRGTVYRHLRLDPDAAAHRSHHVPSALDPHLPYLTRRWAEGCHNGMQLWRDIIARGYKGSRRMVAVWSRQQRSEPAPTTPRKYLVANADTASESDEAAGNAGRGRLPSPRSVSYLLIRRPDLLTEAEREALNQIFAVSTDIATAYPLVHQFQGMMASKAVDHLAGWIQTANACPLADLQNYAAGLEKDRAAIEAALSQPWSNGQTEGQVNRLKMLKRQMYGRANFDLLRRRVLYA